METLKSGTTPALRESNGDDRMGVRILFIGDEMLTRNFSQNSCEQGDTAAYQAHASVCYWAVRSVHGGGEREGADDELGYDVLRWWGFE